MQSAVDIADRLELFVDRQMIDRLEGAELRLHEPQPLPRPENPLPISYTTVMREGGRYRATYRAYRPDYDRDRQDGNVGEITCYAESRDGHEWTFPELDVTDTVGPHGRNVILEETPFCHNLSPFLDTCPEADPAHRYKALAGTKHDMIVERIPGTRRAARARRLKAGHNEQPDARGGLHAFSSPDGIHWSKMRENPVIPHDEEKFGTAFDSQNVSFWSEVEGCYACYFRTKKTLHGKARTIWRTTSPDYIHWTEPVCMNPNLPGEHLYASNTHPYFRAPHIYIALPTRFMPARGSSTDILFMATRAGSASYERLFTEAFIRPGLDPDRWGNRANYVAQNVVPTGPAEMSIYHRDGHRYVLRTDGFVSVHTGADRGEMVTRPFTFAGDELVLNYSTSAAGSLQVEIQQANGSPVPGFRLEDCPEVVGDTIDEAVQWKGSPMLDALAGEPVRLRFSMIECDLYSFRFGGKR